MTIPPDNLDPATAWARIGPDPSADLLPWLARTCASLAADDRERFLATAGFIAVDASDDERTRYAEEIATLRNLALQGLPAASTDAMYVHLQQAILGLDGDELWGHELDHVNDGEADIEWRCSRGGDRLADPDKGPCRYGPPRSAGRADGACHGVIHTLIVPPGGGAPEGESGRNGRRMTGPRAGSVGWGRYPYDLAA
ncbi:hypothetical protein [Winogradskya consettensis]|uniref:hypothetical protein n=1 Tax=Winogradskya consettensis TaxID=113560 RepID=UPI001BB3EB92|nr:hypothetical protein [Actinoplanes consettensis]